MKQRAAISVFAVLAFCVGALAHNPPQGSGSAGGSGHAFGDTAQADILQLGTTGTELFELTPGTVGVGSSNDGVSADGTLAASVADLGGWANVGTTTDAVATGDLAAGDGTRSLFLDASAAILTLDEPTAANRAFFYLTNDSNQGLSMWVTGSTWTPFGTYDPADAGVILTDTALGGGLTLTTLAGGIGIYTGGVPAKRWQFDNTTGSLTGEANVDITLGNGGQFLLRPDSTSGAGNLAIAFSDDTDTGIYSDGANNFKIYAGGDSYQFRTDMLSIPAGNGIELTSGGGADYVGVRDDNAVAFGGAANTAGDTFIQGELTTLTDASATTVLSIVSADGDMGGVAITYTIQATDGTEHQSITNTVFVSTVDDAGGVVASVVPAIAEGSQAKAVSSGTLTESWSVVTTDDQSLEVQCTATSSLTTTTFQIRWVATVSGDVSLTVP